MKPRNRRVLVFVTALLTAPLLPAWGQAPVHPRPPKKTAPKPPQVTIKETPIEQGDAQSPSRGQTPDVHGQVAQTQGTQNPPPSPAAPTPAPPQGSEVQPQPPAPAAPAAPKVMTPEEIGISFSPPAGWQAGDPTKFTLPGNICCAWSPDNLSSIVAFVQPSGRPLRPKVLLEQSAQALHNGVGAEIKTKELRDIGGMKGFSLVVTAAGNGAAIDGKGSVPTTQHWIAIPRSQDVIIFLMTTPDEKFAQNEQVFESLLSTLKVTGTQTPDQQASK